MFRKVKGKSILGKFCCNFCILPYETSVKRKFAVHLMKNVTIAGNLTATVPFCHSLRGPLLLKILSHPLRKCHYIFARPVICRSLGVSLLFFISSYFRGSNETSGECLHSAICRLPRTCDVVTRYCLTKISI